MLFVSRYIQNLVGVQDSFGNVEVQYGVVDTDDDVEEICTWDGLQKVCLGCGVDIEGVVKLPEIGILLSVKPYQLRETITDKQSKLSLLKGVDVVVWNDQITSIIFDRLKSGTETSIRLSDFGNSVADRVFGTPEGRDESLLTIVFDDKVTFTPYSFSISAPWYPGYEHLGVVYDIRELHDDVLAGYLYRMLISRAVRNIDWRKSIIDNPPRYTSWCNRKRD